MKYFIYCRKSTEDAKKQVQSIEDQERILKKLAKEKGLTVIDVLKEIKSAKAPGRPNFNHMIGEIQKGNANGILCWKLDRLARNPIDGGSINWMLQQGIIQSIITPDREYCPTDNVLMMSVEFGMANQFIIDLGKNTKRGMRSKCEKGWYPSVAPQGYLNNRFNEKGKKTIYKDELRFSLVKKMWELMLTGQYSLKKICDKANKEWGYRTTKKRNSGDKKLNVSTLYNIFKNPFYYGEFEWDGTVYQGSHEPMITREEFEHVQAILGSKGRSRGSSKDFPFTGLIKCGECGCAITAEDKTKYLKREKRIQKYTYYHCTHKRKDYKCNQKSINGYKLEAQVSDFLETVTIEDEFIDWIITYLHEFNESEVIDRKFISANLNKGLSESEKKMDNLIKLKISDLITDEEFKSQKKELVQSKANYLDKLNQLNERQNNWVDTAEKAVNFLRSVKVRFNDGSIEEKKIILSTLGSNMELKDGKLTLEANGVYKPFQKGIDLTKQLIARFEPQKGQLKTSKTPSNEALHSIWLLGLDSNQ